MSLHKGASWSPRAVAKRECRRPAHTLYPREALSMTRSPSELEEPRRMIISLIGSFRLFGSSCALILQVQPTGSKPDLSSSKTFPSSLLAGTHSHVYLECAGIKTTAQFPLLGQFSQTFLHARAMPITAIMVRVPVLCHEK